MYTRNWNNATPAGTRAAKEIDDAMREHKVDFYERFITLLDPATDIDTDPLVLKPEITGTATGQQILVGPHILQHIADENDTQWNVAYVESDDVSHAMNGSIILPIGTTITLLEASVDRNTASTVTIEAQIVNFLTGGVSVLTGLLTRAVAGIGLLTSAALTHTMANNEYISIRLAGAGDGRVRCYGFRITYDRVDSTQVY